MTVDPAPSLVLVHGSGQLDLYNRSGSDLQVWGDKLDGFPSDFDRPGHILPTDSFYDFRTDRLRSLMLSTVGDNGERRFPFEVYLSDFKDRNYIATFTLLVRMTSGTMTVQIEKQGLRLASAQWTAP